MEKNIYIVDAFTDIAYAGNPAAVVLDADDLSDDNMQQIAREMNLSETAFVLSGSKASDDIYYDVRVRFFTPTEEVDLCGHATIATFSLLKQMGLLSEIKTNFVQKTKAGLLNVKFENDNVIMKQADPKKINKNIDIDKLSKVMNIKVSDIGSEVDLCVAPIMPEIWSTGLEDILMPIKSAEVLKNMSPNMEELAEYSRMLDVVGVHAFYFDGSDEIVCRNFAPAYGIPEESATGTSNGALGAYLADKGHMDGQVEFIAKQGEGMGRPSRIFVKVSHNPTEVWVGGKAISVMKGSIKIY